MKSIQHGTYINTKLNKNTVQIGNAAGLTSIRELAAYTDTIQKPAKSLDCLLGVVTQPTDSWLSKTNCPIASRGGR